MRDDKGYLGFGMYKYGLYIYIGTIYNDKTSHLFRSQVYCYKLSRDDLYTSTWEFVRDKLMTQAGIA